MKKIMLLVGSMAVMVMLYGCGTPVGITKCQKDFTYLPDGKVKTEYQECISQTPEKLDPIHLKNKELYQ